METLEFLYISLFFRLFLFQLLYVPYLLAQNLHTIQNVMIFFPSSSIRPVLWIQKWPKLKVSCDSFLTDAPSAAYVAVEVINLWIKDEVKKKCLKMLQDLIHLGLKD